MESKVTQEVTPNWMQALKEFGSEAELDEEDGLDLAFISTCSKEPANIKGGLIRLAADEDDGSGFLVWIESKDGKKLCKVAGATLVSNQSENLIKIELRSRRRDFEGDAFYLLKAELVAGSSQWLGRACVLEGVLTNFGWRTEETLTEELKGCPTGDGIFEPKEPLRENRKEAWAGLPSPMMRVVVRVEPRRAQLQAPLAGSWRG